MSQVRFNTDVQIVGQVSGSLGQESSLLLSLAGIRACRRPEKRRTRLNVCEIEAAAALKSSGLCAQHPLKPCSWVALFHTKDAKTVTQTLD